MKELDSMLTIIMWTGAIIGFGFGLYLNISAIRSRRNNRLKRIKK